MVKTQTIWPQSILVPDMARNQNAYLNRRQAIRPIASVFGYPGERIGASATEHRKNQNYEEASPLFERRRDAA
jgi:hypothetical protein